MKSSFAKKQFFGSRKKCFFKHMLALLASLSKSFKINIWEPQKSSYSNNLMTMEPFGDPHLKSDNPTSRLTSLNLLTPPRYLVWPRYKLRIYIYKYIYICIYIKNNKNKYTIFYYMHSVTQTKIQYMINKFTNNDTMYEIWPRWNNSHLVTSWFIRMCGVYLASLI